MDTVVQDSLISTSTQEIFLRNFDSFASEYHEKKCMFRIESSTTLYCVTSKYSGMYMPKTPIDLSQVEHNLCS